MKLSAEQVRALAARFDTYTLVQISKLPARVAVQLLLTYDPRRSRPRPPEKFGEKP